MHKRWLAEPVHKPVDQLAIKLDCISLPDICTVSLKYHNGFADLGVTSNALLWRDMYVNLSTPSAVS